MNGAESLVRTLVASGVEVCFTNPGTSEMHFVAALDRVKGMRSILGLFEGVVTGAADGYGRMAGKPASTLLHLGPGLGNGLANLHNARKANTPIVNIVGQHATYHVQYDAPLNSDIVGIARPVSGWVKESPSSRTVALDGSLAVAAAMEPPGQIATLILPADTAWEECDGPVAPIEARKPPIPSKESVVAAAKALKGAKRGMLMVSGAGLQERGLKAAGRIAAATGAELITETFFSRLRRGAGIVNINRLPYFAEDVVETMKGVDLLVTAGAKPPVAFFAYPGKPSWLTPDDCAIQQLAAPEEDVVAGLEALADELGAPAEPAGVAEASRPELPTGEVSAGSVGNSVAALLPENAIISDESATSGLASYILAGGAEPFDHLQLTGGSIGQGLPLATGAAVACPDRKVVCLHGDGGAMYTVQALWTQARENLDVVTVIFANRSYAILNIELMRVGAENPGPTALSMLDLSNPNLDWVQLAQGMGVEASRPETAEEFNDHFAAAVKAKGPRLIEVVI